MKLQKMFTLVLMMCVAAAVSVADGVTFTPVTSWEQALKLAKDQNKYLFVDAYTDWCGWCKVMDKKTFTDAEVAKIMNEKFVNVKIEMETGYGIDLAIKYRVSSFPQFLVFNPKGELVYRMRGYAPPADFIPELNKSLDPATQTKVPGITSKFPLDAPKFLRDACAKGDERKWPEASEVSAWLDKQKDIESEVSWSVMSRLPLEEKWERYITEHRASLAQKYGAEEVDNKLMQFIQRRAEGAVKKQDRDALEAALSEIPNDFEYRERFTEIFRLRYFREGKKWDLVADLLKADLERGAIDGSVVNEYAWSMYEECDDLKVLSKAVELMQRVVEGAGYAEWDTYAALLYKTGDQRMAETAALKAIELGKAEGQKVGETEELLKKIRLAK